MQKEIKNGLTIDIDLIVFETIRSWQLHECGIAYFFQKEDTWWRHLEICRRKLYDDLIRERHIPDRPLPIYHAITIYLLDAHGARIPLYSANQVANPNPVCFHEGDLTLDGFIQALCHWHETVPEMYQHIVNGTADIATKCKFFESIIQRHI